MELAACGAELKLPARPTVTEPSVTGSIFIHVSDPWDVDATPMCATIVHRSPNEIVARLTESTVICGALRDGVRCTVRHAGETFDKGESEIASNLVFFNFQDESADLVHAIGAVAFTEKATFTSPRPNLYVSSTGYSVEVLGRTGLRYTERNRSLTIDSETLDGPSGMGIYRRSIAHWDAPHANDPLSQAEIERVVDNVRTAFRSQGFEIVVT